MLSQKEVKKKKKKQAQTDLSVSTITTRVKASRADALKGKLEKMTPKRLRSFKGFENIKKEEAQHIIETLEAYCKIVLTQLKSSKEKIKETKSLLKS